MEGSVKNGIFHTGNCAFRALMPEFRPSRNHHNIPGYKRIEGSNAEK